MSRTVSREKYDSLKRKIKNWTNEWEIETSELKNTIDQLTDEKSTLLKELESQPVSNDNAENRRLKDEIASVNEKYRRLEIDHKYSEKDIKRLEKEMANLERKKEKAEEYVDKMRYTIGTNK